MSSNAKLSINMINLGKKMKVKIGSKILMMLT